LPPLFLNNPIKMHPEVIVVGCGAVGSAALYQLARRGIQALGIDRFGPPHNRGSSHGDTRITRLALGEGDEYVQFARRSHEIWRELEAQTGRTLLQQVGALIYGCATGRTTAHGATDFLQTTIDVAQRHALGHEILDAAALAARFPQFRLRGDEIGCLEHGGGFVHPESCIASQLEMATHLGGRVQAGEQVLEWKAGADGVTVTTTRGGYEAGALILTAGAWLPQLVSELAGVARIYRQVLFWFEPDGPPELFTPSHLPVYIRVPDSTTPMFYGFPAIDGQGSGMKLAGEQFDNTTTPDEMPRDVGRPEIEAMYALAGPHLRISPQCVRAAACMYTVLPDFRFLIDRHPDSGRVWLASACSGHGFKHSAAVGEALAELVTSRRTRFNVAPFSIQANPGCASAPMG